MGEPEQTSDGLLRLEECAARTATTVRFWRRLVFERRIPFVKVGKFVRIAEADLEAFVAAGRIEARSPNPND